MALARALTKHLGRSDSVSSGVSPGYETPVRSFSTRKASVKPSEISLPINLISTTNMLSYEAPDIATLRRTINSIDTSNLSAGNSSRSSSDEPTPLLTDGSSAESSPTVEHNHLSCYFPGPTLKRSPSSCKAAAADNEPVPVLPQRAPSHSKREHVRLARKRSIRSSAPPSPTIREDESFTAAAAPAAEDVAFPGTESPLSAPLATGNSHPFSLELERLNEVAEEFHGVAAGWEAEEDKVIMQKKGLSVVLASEYLSIVDSMWPISPFLADITEDENIGGWI